MRNYTLYKLQSTMVKIYLKKYPKATIGDYARHIKGCKNKRRQNG